MKYENKEHTWGPSLDPAVPPLLFPVAYPSYGDDGGGVVIVVPKNIPGVQRHLSLDPAAVRRPTERWSRCCVTRL
jgi:hypothetical protein